MARINVEQKALSDPRFVALAQLLGLADADHAIGKMVRLWNACQEMERYTLPRSIVAAVFGKDGPEALLEVGLAKTRNRGALYLCGTRGRIEWLKNRRMDGKKGGRPRNPRVLPADNPPAPAPAPAPTPPNKKTNAATASPPQPGFDLWWEELRPWFKAANRRLAYKQDARKVWKSKGLEQYASTIIDRAIAQRNHFLDAQRSGQRPPPPQDPHRYLKNRRYNDEL